MSIFSKAYIVAAVLAILAGMWLLWGIVEARAKVKTAQADQLRARAQVIEARKQGRREGWRRAHGDQPATACPADLFADLDALEQAASSGQQAEDAILPAPSAFPLPPSALFGGSSMFSFAASWLAVAAGVVFVLALIVPKLKPVLVKFWPQGAAGLEKASEVASISAVWLQLQSISAVRAARGDQEGVELCRKLWTRASQWALPDAQPATTTEPEKPK